MDTSIPNLVDLFTATKLTEGKSPKTLTLYRDFLTKYSTSLGEKTTLREMTLDSARTFVASLQSRTTRYENHPINHVREGGLSPYTVHSYVRVFKTFSSWLADEGFLKINVFSKLKRPKLPTTVIEILSPDEIASIFARINPSCPQGARLFLVVLLLLDTGIRASELCTLTLENTFVKEGYIKVSGKGDKERIVPFGATTKKALMRYLTTFRPQSDDPYLVLTSQGAITYTALNHCIKRLGISVGIPRLHPHLFRHTFAVNYLMNGGDIMSLRLMLGHTDISVTQMYLHLSESHVQIQHAKFSPVDRLLLGGKKRTAS